MEENMKEKVNGEVLIGVKDIEWHLKRSYINLVTLRANYSFPLRNTDGLPSVELKEFEAWLLEWGGGLPFNQITSAVLQRKLRLKQIEAMQPKRLSGINEISNYTGCPIDEVLNWFKFGVNCPIKSDSAKSLFVDAKELLLWTHGMGISRLREERSFDSF